MKNLLKLVLALLLVLAVAGSACAELSLTPIADLPGSADWVTDTNAIALRTETGYALCDADGKMLTEPVYDFDSAEYGYIPACKLTADRANNGGYGLITPAGEEIIPHDYGYVKVLNAHWAMACTLTPTTEDQERDLTVIVFGGETEYYNFAAVDLYSLDSRSRMVSIPGEEFLGANAMGSYINVGNAATNTGATYDSAYQLVGDGITGLYDDRHVPAEALNEENVPDSFYKDGKYGLRDAAGNVIREPEFNLVYGFYGGYARATMGEEDSERSGLINLQGEWVVPAEYDDFRTYSRGEIERQSSYVTDGYITAVRDGKLVFLDAQGQVSCDTGYPADDLSLNGTSACWHDYESKTGQIFAADGVITTLENCDSLSRCRYAAGKYYTARLNGETVLLDWHGGIVLSGTQDAGNASYYYSFDFSRDMSRIILDTRDGYKLCSTGL